TKQNEKETKAELEETKLAEVEKTKEEEKGEKEIELSPETLEREAKTIFAALSTLVKPKQKWERPP
ncbi:hypothetical protein OYG15_10645, partial [Actinobacillus pleuropneumoniae]|uniref:hypothetical protein n=1 Tax=Actinobacillus pleuropneumoniae TaxID=715 RepID=UPI0022776A80